MDIDDEELPELKLIAEQQDKCEPMNEEKHSSGDTSVKKSVNGKQEKESIWPEYDFCWQDFVPASLSPLFFAAPTSEVPSFLSLVTDVSDFLPDSALFFNFVFDWWFTEPLHPDEDSVKVVVLKYPCTKCDLKFQFDWEVPKHYLETHLASAPPRPKSPEPVKVPTPEPVRIPTPEPVREPTPEIFIDPYPPLEDWCWQDFLPDWSDYFLPSPGYDEYDGSDIEDDDPDPEPVTKTPPPPPPPQPRPVRPERPSLPAPVIKQSKFECRTCAKTICNSCFTKKCGAHNVDFKGTAKFACGLC